MSQKVSIDGIGDAMKQAFKKFGTVTTEDVGVAAKYAAKEALQTLSFLSSSASPSARPDSSSDRGSPAAAHSTAVHLHLSGCMTRLK